MRRSCICLSVLVFLASASLAQAAGCRGNQPFGTWIEEFTREALTAGISRQTLASVQPYFIYDQSIVNRDRGQGVFAQSFLQFSDRMASAYRTQKAGQLIQQHAAVFDRIEKEFGVPAQPILAFWGLETDFGANIGDLPTIRSLVSLGFDCRRSEMFQKELLSALKVIQRGDLQPDAMRGPWAGELGQLQFLPSHYFDYAVDYDGDGRRDLLNSAADALGSAGNFLSKLGWKRGEPWLTEVRVPQNLPWHQADLSIQHPRSQWAKLGVTLANGQPLPADDLKASVLLPMGRFGPAFLAHDNFQIFLKWNQSLVYSTTAAYLANRIAGAPPVQRGTQQIASLDAKQLLELQKLLVARGFEPGKPDGKMGFDTKAAVKQAQIKLGLPADSYPNLELIERLRR
jgi:lytic murein transglycosylase